MPPLASSSTASDSNDPFVLGGPVRTDTGKLITGQNLAAYTAVGRITASGKLTKALDTADDGSQTIIGFTCHAVNATSADKDCPYYCAGKFNSELAVIDDSYTATELKAELDRTGLQLETPL
ncbi:MAG TPA: head decoration protein [Hyphomicrobiales bacterium]|nr:head decoration protein [Hyphomicrobiales bacterium]